MDQKQLNVSRFNKPQYRYGLQQPAIINGDFLDPNWQLKVTANLIPIHYKRGYGHTENTS
jgi:hypothetical protein